MSDMNFTVSQSAAIGRLQGNTAVSAGAGSGKTRVLVERYLRLVEQSLSGGARTGVSDIVAITFTKKAAGELRERVRRELERRAAADVLHAAFWRQQLEELPKAQISTIHGYCSRLLREHPVELALAPDFQVAEEFAAEEFLQECLKKFLRLRFGSSSALKELAKQYGGQAVLRQLELLLPHVEEIASAKLTVPYEENIAAAQLLYGQIAELWEELLAQETELATKSNKDFFRELAENLPEITAALRERQDRAPFDKFFQEHPGMVRGKLSAYFKEIKALRDKLDIAEVDRQALPLVRLWQDLLQDFAGFLRQEKQQRDFLSFDDLETLALELLQRHPEVRRACQKRVRYLMVDEFQDTNERQKQLVYLLCGDDKNELQGGKLFVVGDPKQSIYRFRGADVGVFAEVRRAVADKDSAGVIAMYDNFRTTDAILQAVDAAFSTLMGTDTEQDVYFEPLLPHVHGNMRPMFLQVPYDKASEGERRRLEAEAVAREIEARHARPYSYCDSEGREHTEAPSYKDMAVLLGRFTHVQTLTEALRRHNIPFVVQNGRGFYDCQEVLDLLNLLQALQNKYNNIALAGALRSPYFGLDDESLTRLFLSLEKDGSLLDALLAADDNLYDAGQRELLRARAICGRLRLAASVCGLPELWQAVEAELQPDVVLARQEDGEQKLANVRKLRQLALQFAAVQNASLGEWLAYTDRLRRQEVRETAANLPAGDAVTIMTVHASKGLEFKTVILPMLDTQGKADSDMIRFDKQLGLGIKAVLPDGSLKDSSVYKAVKEREKALAAAESLRLLYVAMTRAQYDLLLSGAYNIEGKKNDASSWFNLLRRAYDGSDAVEFKEVDLRGLESDAAPETERTPLPVPPELLAAAAPLPAFEQGLTAFSPSFLQEYLFCQRAFFYRYIARLPELELLGKAAAQAAESGEGEPAMPPKLAGSLIHKALELLHWEALPPSLSKERREKAEAAWQAALAEIAPEYAGRASAGKAREMLFNYIYSGLYQGIAPEHRREQRFSLVYGGYEFSGVLDCLYQDGAGLWHIVDYKTGRPPQTQDGAQLPLGYACQLALYRQAAAELFGAAGAVAELHFLQDNSCWPLPPEADFLQQALALCDEINAKKMAEGAFACAADRQRCAFCSYNYLCSRM